MSRQGVAFVLTEYPCKTRLDTGLIGTEKILVKKISFWSKKVLVWLVRLARLARLARLVRLKVSCVMLG